MGNYVIAIDVGGTNIRVALLNKELHIVKKECALTMDYPYADKFLLKIAQMVKQVDPDKNAEAVGIALPAPWRKDCKTIDDITNLPWLEGVDVETVCSYLNGYKVHIENDVNVIALLESDCGSSKHTQNSVYITVSSGIGSGMIINNDIYHGAHGYAGEIGSMIITKFVGDTVKHSTFEEECSGMSLDEKSFELYGNGYNARELFTQYESGEQEAQHFVKNWIDMMTNGLAAVVQMVDPEIIVLGGPVLLRHQWVIETLRKEVAGKVLGKLADKVELVGASFGLEAGLLGAGYFALRQEEMRRY